MRPQCHLKTQYNHETAMLCGDSQKVTNKREKNRMDHKANQAVDYSIAVFRYISDS